MPKVLPASTETASSVEPVCMCKGPDQDMTIMLALTSFGAKTPGPQFSGDYRSDASNTDDGKGGTTFAPQRPGPAKSNISVSVENRRKEKKRKYRIKGRGGQPEVGYTAADESEGSRAIGSPHQGNDESEISDLVDGVQKMKVQDNGEGGESQPDESYNADDESDGYTSGNESEGGVVDTSPPRGDIESKISGLVGTFQRLGVRKDGELHGAQREEGYDSDGSFTDDAGEKAFAVQPKGDARSETSVTVSAGVKAPDVPFKRGFLTGKEW